MSRLIIPLIIAAVVYIFWQELKRRPPDQRRGFLIRSGFWALLALVFVAVATGRLHWLAAAITAAIPVIKGLLGLALRSLPFLQIWLKKRQEQSQEPGNLGNPKKSKLSEDDAWQMLGLEPGATREEIIEAHKKLIQKLHPDRGGNDFLAAQLNAARDLLLKNL